jgi:nitroimidazol reductase NimA-like FMN-containing flavoprotein (pyridoxamine 5'-phosphate oxidase superfamily)
MNRTPSRSRVRRHPERALDSREDAEAILAQGLVAHVGFAHEGQPFVLPFAYLFHGGYLYLHGAPASRTVRMLRNGAPVCVEVTTIDALIASRDAEKHSMNYRSAVCFGTARVIRDRLKKREVLETMIARYFPGRHAGADYAGITEKELRGVELLEVAIDELSAKARSGGPLGPRDADPDAPGSAGIVPLPELPRSL